nr:5'-methylthioadenosine/S-adenosylhomocysteine nucleosidase [Actinoplanes deccanensis]
MVILTALDLEYEAVRDKLHGLRPHTHQHGTRFEVGELPGGGRAALALVGKGNHPAAVLAERAIAEFSPAAVLFAGVAGALYSHLELGDVVVATHVYAYHGGTSDDDGQHSRPRAWEISHHADQVARHLARRVPEKVRFGPIAAGEVVLDSVTSYHARWVHEHYNDAVAIEMEGAGVAQAGHLNSALPVVVVRGISDRADGTKTTTDRQRWQEKAVANAANFAVALAAELNRSLPKNPRSPVVDPTTPAVVTNNSASGNASVGIQAGQVYGAVNSSQSRPAAGIAEQLSGFREELRHARRAGLVSEDDYSAAEAELTVAGKSLAKTPPDQRKLLTALKRLVGLVSDVAELASRLATIIGAVKGMP